MEASSEIIMGALLVLHPRDFSDLTRSLASDLTLHQDRLSFLLLSPPYFTQILAHLHSLTLGQKALLLARLLLRSLHKLLPFSSPSGRRRILRLVDFDAAILLLTMCEAHDRADSPCFDWRTRISRHVLCHMLSPAGLGAHEWGVVGCYIGSAVKCRRLLEAASGGGVGKAGGGVAASEAAVFSLPSVECSSSGWECAVCKEEIEVGRDACGLPCDHVFHWACIVRWLGRRNTCPCCRFELPTDDVFAEIERVWRNAVRMGGRSLGGELER